MSRLFPILFGYRERESIYELRAEQCALIVALPWDLLKPHEGQALKNHSQTLERLAERGGLSHCEALAVLEDRLLPSSSASSARSSGASTRQKLELVTGGKRS